MIEFPCRCGRGFSVPDDQAGNSFQCPDCHLLVEVPLLSDLQNIDKDGSFKIEELKIKPDPQQIKEIRRIYLAGHTGRDTQQVDLRTSFEDLKKAGATEIPKDSKDGLVPGAPLYDPVTGELIEPLDIKAEPAKPMAAIPVAMEGNTLNYEKQESAVFTPLSYRQIFNAVTRSGSIAAIAVIVLVHLYSFVILSIISYGFWFALILGVPAFLMLLSYCPKLVIEFGPGEADELPGVFKDAEFSGDIWSPFLCLLGAFLICYLPALFISAPPIRIAWLCFGTFIFPAILMTTCCSGILVDLRPDRVIAVIKYCGGNYFISVLLWLATVYGYGTVLGGILSPDFSSFATYLFMILLIPSLFLPILFSIHLASLYRAHFAQFPWVFQDQVIRLKRAERAKRRRSKKLKYNSDSPNSPSATRGH